MVGLNWDTFEFGNKFENEENPNFVISVSTQEVSLINFSQFFVDAFLKISYSKYIF